MEPIGEVLGPTADGEELVLWEKGFVDFLLRLVPIIFSSLDPGFFWEQVLKKPEMKSRGCLRKDNSRLQQSPVGLETREKVFSVSTANTHAQSDWILAIFLQLVSRPPACLIATDPRQLLVSSPTQEPSSHCLTNELQPLSLCTQGSLPPFTYLTVLANQWVHATQTCTALFWFPSIWLDDNIRTKLSFASEVAFGQVISLPCTSFYLYIYIYI